MIRYYLYSRMVCRKKLLEALPPLITILAPFARLLREIRPPPLLYPPGSVPKPSSYFGP